MPSEIPQTYTALFTILDPIIALWGASLFLLSPKTVTSSYLPTQPSSFDGDPAKSHPAAFAAPNSPSHAFTLPLHAQIAGHLLSNALLSAFLLRVAPALRIWRIYQLSVLLVDGFLLYGTFASYAVQDRLDPLTTWRAEDWGAVGITALAALTRVAFLLRLGFPKRQKAKKA
ncbi:hypothetical protein CCHL11_06990 [Colletotrichum chlorophyti]|uniref:DUF7704 domain-containing protein n=1 Tax=Colletotrichum chlorophyti TaxID=708187 RepID=A0A1Q8RCG3_9PEZI|nr:hypothetical protein CCHL11_06990 [Colletotrichum chlorophyti]